MTRDLGVERRAKSGIMTRPSRAMTFHDFFILFWRLILAAAFLIVILASAAFLFPHQFLTIDSGEVKGDVLVVLGGEGGRADHAAALYLQGVAPLVAVTGYGDCQFNVQTLERKGVPPRAILTEPAALTTMQNAEFSVPLLRAHNAHRVILVTSWYHSRRALACFEHVAPDLQFFSRPSYLDYEPKPANRMGYDWHVNYEYVKLVAYIFTHHVWPF